MSRVFVVVVGVFLIAVPAWADTITVVGLVAYKPTGAPRAGIEVGLYCDAMKGCKLGVKKSTNTDGMYTMSKGNIAVGKVFVIYDGSQQYTADPVLVGVDCPGANEPCVLTAKKLLLQPLPSATNNRAAALWINAYANTQSVKVWAGVIDAEQANEATTREAAKILGVATGIQKASAEQTLESVFDVVRSMPPIEGLPNVKVLSQPTEFMKVKNHKEFNKFREMSGDPARLKMKGTDVAEELRYFLALPNADIKMEWVDDEKHVAFVSGYLKDKKAGSSSMLHFMGKDKSEISLPVIDSVSGLDDQGIRTTLKKNPELRAWAFYDRLLHDKVIPPNYVPAVLDRLEGLRPTVIEPRP